MYLDFFFKQKTAYELRISDWCSDVCSSDLSGDLRGFADHRGIEPIDRGDIDDRATPSLQHPGNNRLHAEQGAQQVHVHDQPVEIGSASCRERVCQYV